MTDRALYPTRLYYENGKGVARHGGVEVILHKRPAVLGHIDGFLQLDYAPGLGVWLVQSISSPVRDLTDAEIVEIRQALENMLLRERAFWEGSIPV